MNALVRPQTALTAPVDQFAGETPALAIFDHVPRGCDVVTLSGMVAIYDTRWNDLREGAYYVLENQRPVNGMSWETFDMLNARHGPSEPRVCLKTSRRVVRATRRDATGDAWWFVQESGFHDGPYADWAAGRDFVGEVIGIYRPGPA